MVDKRKDKRCKWCGRRLAESNGYCAQCSKLLRSSITGKRRRTADKAHELADYITEMIDNEPDTSGLRFIQDHQSEGDQPLLFLKVIIPYEKY